MVDQGSHDIAELKVQLLARLGAENADAYPAKIEQDFPHILERVVALWGKPGADAYLDSLMVADRPDRRGFPADVAMEIFRLSMVHSSLGLSREQQGTGWTGVDDPELYRKALKKDL